MRRAKTYGVPALWTLVLAMAILLATDWGSGRAAVADTGSLTFEVEMPVTYPPATCPAGTSNSVECFTRTGSGIVRGLGTVQESFPYFVDNTPPGCAADQVRALPTTALLSVPGKGEIDVRLDGTGCLTRIPPAPVIGEETFTITGGSGRYAGASGGGTIAHRSTAAAGFRGSDTWTGSLAVPGLAFDLTPPVLSGARNRTIRAPHKAKRIRVTYSVTASDAVDGAVPAKCTPRSGSRFKIGRNVVRCSATDSSANTGAARFTIAVKRKR
jgi:HYR domain-containing protein